MSNTKLRELLSALVAKLDDEAEEDAQAEFISWAQAVTDALEPAATGDIECTRHDYDSAGHCVECGHAWWQRSQPAPAAVRMTEELREVLEFAANCHKDANTDTRVLWNPDYLVDVWKSIAAVRSQAAPAGKVTLLQVRIALDTMRAHFEPDCQGGCQFPMVWDICRAALAELDAAEGRK